MSKAFLKLRRRPNWETGRGRSIRAVDLFCGCGGMSLGLVAACVEQGVPLKLVGAVDFDADAAELYSRNFDFAADCADIGEMFGSPGSRTNSRERAFVAKCGDVSVLMGGPPCQGNSDLNNHTRREDPRNELYLSMARAAQLLRPRLVVVENVPAVVHGRSRVVERTKLALQKLGYNVVHGVEDLAKLGIPQTRRRHILVASRDDLSGWEHASREVPIRTVRWAIGDIEGRAMSPGELSVDSPSRLSADNERRREWLLRHGAFILPDSKRPPCHRDKVHSYKSVYGRMQWDRPAPTITTGFGSMGQGCYVHPNGTRLITPHEAARIQTFPDFFEFALVAKRTAWSKTIGNAVPPLLMAGLAKSLLW